MTPKKRSLEFNNNTPGHLAACVVEYTQRYHIPILRQDPRYVLRLESDVTRYREIRMRTTQPPDDTAVGVVDLVQGIGMSVVRSHEHQSLQARIIKLGNLHTLTKISSPRRRIYLERSCDYNNIWSGRRVSSGYVSDREKTSGTLLLTTPATGQSV